MISRSRESTRPGKCLPFSSSTLLGSGSPLCTFVGTFYCDWNPSGLSLNDLKTCPGLVDFHEVPPPPRTRLVKNKVYIRVRTGECRRTHLPRPVADYLRLPKYGSDVVKFLDVASTRHDFEVQDYITVLIQSRNYVTKYENFTKCW